MNNSMYGKTMENLRNRVDVIVATNSKDYQKLVSKPSFFLKRYSMKIC